MRAARQVLLTIENSAFLTNYQVGFGKLPTREAELATTAISSAGSTHVFFTSISPTANSSGGLISRASSISAISRLPNVLLLPSSFQRTLAPSVQLPCASSPSKKAIHTLSAFFRAQKRRANSIMVPVPEPPSSAPTKLGILTVS